MRNVTGAVTSSPQLAAQASLDAWHGSTGPGHSEDIYHEAESGQTSLQKKWRWLKSSGWDTSLHTQEVQWHKTTAQRRQKGKPPKNTGWKEGFGGSLTSSRREREMKKVAGLKAQCSVFQAAWLLEDEQSTVTHTDTQTHTPLMCQLRIW